MPIALTRLAGSLLLILFLVCPGQAQSLTLAQVTERLEKARDGIDDISAKAAFSFHLQAGILPYNDTLYGSYFFKKPDKHRLEFPDAPSYLKSVPSMFSWKLPSSEKYSCVVSGPVMLNRDRIYKLVYTSKNPSSKTATITVIVDAAKWRVSRQDTAYRDGGSVLLTFAYQDWKGQSLLQKVSGVLNIPAYSLTGDAAITLSDQKVNQGVDDSVFSSES